MPLSATFTTSSGSSGASLPKVAGSTSRVFRLRALTPTSAAPSVDGALGLGLVVHLDQGGQPELAGQVVEADAARRRAARRRSAGPGRRRRPGPRAAGRARPRSPCAAPGCRPRRAPRRRSSRLPPKRRSSVSTLIAAAPPRSYAAARAAGSGMSARSPLLGLRRLTSAITEEPGCAEAPASGRAPAARRAAGARSSVSGISACRRARSSRTPATMSSSTDMTRPPGPPVEQAESPPSLSRDPSPALTRPRRGPCPARSRHGHVRVAPSRPPHGGRRQQGTSMSYDAPPPPQSPYGGLPTVRARGAEQQQGHLGAGLRHPRPALLRVPARHPRDHPRASGAGGRTTGGGVAKAGEILGYVAIALHGALVDPVRGRHAQRRHERQLTTGQGASQLPGQVAGDRERQRPRAPRPSLTARGSAGTTVAPRPCHATQVQRARSDDARTGSPARAAGCSTRPAPRWPSVRSFTPRRPPQPGQ